MHLYFTKLVIQLIAVLSFISEVALLTSRAILNCDNDTSLESMTQVLCRNNVTKEFSYADTVKKVSACEVIAINNPAVF